MEPILTQENLKLLDRVLMELATTDNLYACDNPEGKNLFQLKHSELVKEIRVVTKDGNLYSITNPKNKKLDFEAIKKTYNESYERASKKAIERFMKGEIEKKDLENQVRHIQWEITKKEHGFEYERKKW
jgi:alpha-galactosidase